MIGQRVIWTVFAGRTGQKIVELQYYIDAADMLY